MSIILDFLLLSGDRKREGSEWTLHGCYLSDVCCALHLSLRNTGGGERAARSDLDDLIDGTGRGVVGGKRNAGILRPLVALVDVERSDKARGAAFDQAWRSALQEWTYSQTWHAGRFVLEAVERSAEVPVRLLELLTAWRDTGAPVRFEQRTEPKLIAALAPQSRFIDVLRSDGPRGEQVDARAKRWMEGVRDTIRTTTDQAEMMIARAENDV